eukprot:TRINITY_DN7421_c0_g8_i2.p1 TRINITY_DN7421_c0_g8~~TRINITY_DN7421_c0_g8_i2.p1  ORF type:complete len:317 (-),score=55.57 TRINITY_DN7421_c0_g8_i2:145-1095(-)
MKLSGHIPRIAFIALVAGQAAALPALEGSKKLRAAKSLAIEEAHHEVKAKTASVVGEADLSDLSESALVAQYQLEHQADTDVSLSQAQMHVSQSTQTEKAQQEFRDAFMRAFFVVGVAEIFDKTWFVALLCAIQYSRAISFFSSFLALSLHVVLAAGLGIAVSRFFTLSSLCFSSATVFGALAVMYTIDFFKAKANETIEGRTEEAMEILHGDKDSLNKTVLDMMYRSFFAVFLAEFGDRTQIAMVTLHSSEPWIPVCLGSLLAFFVLTASAIMAARLLEGQRLTEKLVLGMSAGCFFVFTALSVRDGLTALTHGN